SSSSQSKRSAEAAFEAKSPGVPTVIISVIVATASAGNHRTHCHGARRDERRRSLASKFHHPARIANRAPARNGALRPVTIAGPPPERLGGGSMGLVGASCKSPVEQRVTSEGRP